MKQVTKRLLSLALALLLLVPGVLSVTAYGTEPYGNGENTVQDGESFAVDKTYTTSKLIEEAPRTFEATFHLPKSYDGNARPGVIFGNYSNNSTPSLSFELETAKKIRLYYNTGRQTGNIYFSYDVRSDDYITIAVTLDPSTNKAILYVNGEMVSEQTSNTVSNFCGVLTANKFMVGGDLRTETTNQQYFKGKIKNVAVYSDTRTADEISSDYTNGADSEDENLLCAYDLTSTDFNVRIQDLSKNNNDLIYSVPNLNDELMYQGLTFTNDNTYRMHKAFAESPITMEAEIFVPTSVTDRAGVIAGNYVSGKWSSNLEIYSAGKPRLYFEKNGGTAYSFVFDKVDVRTGTWVNLAIVLEAELGLVHCYIDGELMQTINNGSPIVIENESVYSSSFYLGRDTRSTVYFKGSIKSLAIYSDVRTNEEILSDTERFDLTDEELLCAYYFMESTKRNDLSGNGNHIYYSGEEIDEPEEDEEIWELDGLRFKSDTFATVDKNLKANLPLTFESTILLPQDVTGRGGVIFGNFVDSAYKYLSFEIYDNGHPRLTFNSPEESAARDYRFNQVKVNTGKAIHLAITFDPVNNIISCYINGELAQSLDSNNASYDRNITSSYLFMVGNDPRSSQWTQYFKGTINSLTLYSDVRTPEEIKADYENVNLENDGLILHYDFSEATVGQNVNDLSGNGYTLKFGSRDNAEISPWIDVVPPQDYLYSFAIVGDTQIINRYHGNDFAKIYDWIIANQKEQNIQYVFGLGDITDADSQAEWQRAQNILRLNGIVPYSVVRGNHDSVSKFNALFTANSDYMAQFDGFFANGDARNAYRKIIIGNTKFLTITLDYGASDEVLAWASNIIEANKDYKVIISTHAYLYRDGTTLDSGDVCPPATSGGYNNGDHMWDKLISQHENIFLVLSGHDPSAQVVLSQKTGVNGNLATQLLVDHQGVDKSTPTGMVTMLYVKADGSIEVQTYSTIQEKYYRESNQFVIEETEHAYGESKSFAYENGFLQPGAMVSACNSCGYEHSFNTKPLFVFSGYSFKETDSSSICVGYVINFDLVKLYEEMNNTSIKIGLSAAAYDNLCVQGKPINSDGSTGDTTQGKIINYELCEGTKHVSFILTSADWTVLGDTKLILCAYFIIDENVFYICHKDIATETADYIIYNELIQDKE